MTSSCGDKLEGEGVEREAFFAAFIKFSPASFERWRAELPWWQRPFASRAAYITGFEVGARAIDIVRGRLNPSPKVHPMSDKQHVMGDVLPREAYEGCGGWKDGRWGQAYDLIHAALKDAGDPLPHASPLLKQIEQEGTA